MWSCRRRRFSSSCYVLCRPYRGFRGLYLGDRGLLVELGCLGCSVQFMFVCCIIRKGKRDTSPFSFTKCAHCVVEASQSSEKQEDGCVSCRIVYLSKSEHVVYVSKTGRPGSRGSIDILIQSRTAVGTFETRIGGSRADCSHTKSAKRSTRSTKTISFSHQNSRKQQHQSDRTPLHYASRT